MYAVGNMSFSINLRPERDNKDSSLVPESSDSDEIKSFQVKISDDDVERLYDKIAETRQPRSDVVPDAGEDYGVPTKWMNDVREYWVRQFKWETTQNAINRFDHFTTGIEGLNIHFVHQKSSKPDAIPILLIHGWPGSFHEFSEVINPLCQGSDNGPSFHCVVPSLPGFCFSSPPPRRGWTVKDTARVFHTLMQRLGYTKYAIQSGDWGQFVTRELGANPAYADSCKVIHLNWCPGALPEDLKDGDLSEREKYARDKGIDWRTNHVGYAVLMRTRPQSLDWMVRDNPLGLLSFVGEKYHEASSPEVYNTNKWRQHVLTTVCLYYFTNCLATSALVYYENAPHHLFASHVVAEENKIKCPFGYTSYYFDTAPNSKRAVERTGNLVFYKERDYAGHFACLEDPKGVVEDVREIVAKHWS